MGWARRGTASSRRSGVKPLAYIPAPRKTSPFYLKVAMRVFHYKEKLALSKPLSLNNPLISEG